MADPKTVKLPGSEEHLRAGEHWVSNADTPAAQVSVTFYLRRPANVPAAQGLSREAAEQALTATPQDVDAVTSFAKENSLEVTKVDPPSRRISVSGTPEALSKAFGVQTQYAADASGHQFLTYEGTITLPAAVSSAVEAVLGLSQRSVAKHH